MNMEQEIINRVAESAITTLNLEDYFPKDEIVEFDIKNFLFMGLIIKEKDFRAALLNTDWSQFHNKYVAVFCSADAIIPFWVYMLLAKYLQPVAKDMVMGDKKMLIHTVMQKNISSINFAEFINKRVVIKGCGDLPVPESAYMEITKHLLPLAKSIMYGEPCSTVPIYKKS